MNGVWAVVPVKCFARGKSRLDRVLTRSAREDLARALSEHVLATLTRCPEIEGVVVATDCAIVEELVRSHGVDVVRDIPSTASDGEVGSASLAQIVDHVLARLAAQGARAALVLMADLPLVTPDDIRALAGALDRAPLVIAPDRVRRGTNALALSPPDRMPTCFGSEVSFRRHVARARREGVPFVIHRSDGIAFDLDSPDDLARAQTVRYAERGALLRWNRKRPSRVRAA